MSMEFSGHGLCIQIWKQADSDYLALLLYSRPHTSKTSPDLPSARKSPPMANTTDTTSPVPPPQPHQAGATCVFEVGGQFTMPAEDVIDSVAHKHTEALQRVAAAEQAYNQSIACIEDLVRKDNRFAPYLSAIPGPVLVLRQGIVNATCNLMYLCCLHRLSSRQETLNLAWYIKFTLGS
ncbi:hypothetical protein FA15DRAFT_704411 [Coprinopsis marcescibilis]|uniref:Uncharacterized protein n=1 Tax=Coprinopsis marcescibilis TaxID=230819 RepID=A0A5C3KXS9_COPMA|nr:hypothetical protein FA15DRAFT_704411 [Coprinopsis marcescibilis]